jgi:hypothetical protein
VNPEDIGLRTATAADYDQIIAVVDDWWGRPIRHALARVFLDHFFATSTIAEGDGELAGFLIGFLSPSQPDAAYIHFVGVQVLFQRRLILSTSLIGIASDSADPPGG